MFLLNLDLDQSHLTQSAEKKWFVYFGNPEKTIFLVTVSTKKFFQIAPSPKVRPPWRFPAEDPKLSLFLGSLRFFSCFRFAIPHFMAYPPPQTCCFLCRPLHSALPVSATTALPEGTPPGGGVQPACTCFPAAPSQLWTPPKGPLKRGWANPLKPGWTENWTENL